MNNIPYFLSHLPIWNSEPMKEPPFKKTVLKNWEAPKSRTGPKAQPKIEKVCPACGAKFYVVKSQSNRVACSRSCSNAYRATDEYKQMRSEATKKVWRKKLESL